jgi:hypothetical protein
MTKLIIETGKIAEIDDVFLSQIASCLEINTEDTTYSSKGKINYPIKKGGLVDLTI